MKRIVILVFLGMFLAGCANVGADLRVRPDETQTAVMAEANEPNAVITVSDVNAGFPKELVGTWKADKQNWQFEFDENGQIKNFTHFFGGAKVIPGVETIVPISLAANIFYEPGECGAEFDLATNVLAVKVELLKIEIKGLLEGQSTDLIVGNVSEDRTTWFAEWHSNNKFYAMKENNEPALIPNDVAFEDATPLIFRKLLDSNLEEVKKGQK